MSLYEHQQKEVEQHTFAPARALFWEMRVGKTRTIVEQIRRLSLARILVAAPIMALRLSWKDELAALDAEVVDLSSGTLEERAKKLEVLKKYPPVCPVIVLMNYEVLKPLELALVKWNPEGIVVDEGHLIKNPSSQRARVLVKLAAKAKWKRLLTGTPTPRDYGDVYGQYRFLDPTVFGTSKARFYAEYCYTHPQWKSKITGYKNLPALEKKLFSIATRVTRAECFDVPKRLEIERRVELPERAQEAYNQMVTREVLEMAGLPHVDATHKLARLVKLQKLCAGFISEGDTVVWVHKEKIEAVLCELAEPLEAGHKVVVSYYFEAEGAEIERAIRERYGPCVERLSGQTPQRDRERITRPFGLAARMERGAAGGVLVVQEAVASLGISLAGADHMIITSSSFDGAAHSQLLDRIWAPDKTLNYTYIRVPSSVDGYIKKVLQTKATAQHALLDIGFAAAAYGGDELEMAA